ncbi:hypothetical protein [Nannocystis radixulma]|uniref:Uncharacterized protein n=1 Tax=Nannocystis radixulma TaxID=2995305 RepID=A0ABT5AWC6_9BACT|nr:hypothetical protein [Nannocystis radixulma]MDC0666116.1 hypothetical protein [Nannocystis radixulma]
MALDRGAALSSTAPAAVGYDDSVDDALLELERGNLDLELRRACAAALLARGDPRGRFLALDLELAATPLQKPVVGTYRPGLTAEFSARQVALDELARTLDLDWLARVGAVSHRRVHLWKPSGRPGEPPKLLPAGLREADLKPWPGRARCENPAATLLQSFRWALPGPVLEIAVVGSSEYVCPWVPHVYWCTIPPGRDGSRLHAVELRTPPPERLQAIRFIREVTGCNLLTARDRLDNLPCVLLETYDFAEVLAMLDRVTAAGGLATVDGEPFPPDPPPLLAEGVSLLEFGRPVLVILRADEDALEVRDHAIRWTGAHSNERAHVLRTRWRWSELPADPVERLRVVRPAIDAAVAARRASFFECRLCQQVTEPEWRYREGICTECAEKRLGVVF